MNNVHLIVVALCLAFAAAPALAHVPAGTPDPACLGNVKTHDYGTPATGHHLGPPQDGCVTRDDEPEFAAGGAYFAAGAAALDCRGIVPHHGAGGSITVYASDSFSHGSIALTVISDWAREDDPTAPPCGDRVFEWCDPTDPAEVPGVTCNPRDQRKHCPAPSWPYSWLLDGQQVPPTNVAMPAPPEPRACTVPFGPGQDGMYLVYVGPGLQGHVWSD